MNNNSLDNFVAAINSSPIARILLNFHLLDSISRELGDGLPE